MMVNTSNNRPCVFCLEPEDRLVAENTFGSLKKAKSRRSELIGVPKGSCNSVQPELDSPH